MAITKIQQATLDQGATNASISLGSAITPGNLIVFAVYTRNGTSATTFTFSAETWNLLGRTCCTTATGIWPAAIYWIIAPGGMSNTITCTAAGGSPSTTQRYVAEYSGISGVDTGATVLTPSGRAPNNVGSDTYTPTSGLEQLLVSIATWRTDTLPGVFAPTTGFTEDYESNGANGPACTFNSRIVSSTSGGYTVASTHTGTGNDAGLVAGSFLGIVAVASHSQSIVIT